MENRDGFYIAELTTNQLKAIQTIELQVLKKFDEICVKHDLKYTFVGGTLIGAIRHKGFIPWDDDIDIAMPRKDFDKFKKYAIEELGENFFYQCIDTDQEYKYLYDKIRVNNTVFKEAYLAIYNIHHGIFFDIFPLDYLPSNLVNRWLLLNKCNFFRTILMCKYLDVNARKGKKKILAIILKTIFNPLSYDFIIKQWRRMEKEGDEKSGLICMLENPKRKKQIFEEKWFENLERVQFETIHGYIISEYDSYLIKNFGNYMILPPDEKRKAIHDLYELKL